MDIKEEFRFQLKLLNHTGDAFRWCIDNLELGSWKTLIPLFGVSKTFYFKNEEDAMAFKILWYYD